MSDFDPRELRNAFGSFATGVTIVTTIAKDGDGNDIPVAVTANSFSSVSMDPPLVLWSIDKNSQSLKAFEESNFFAIHILHNAQEQLSNICATKNADKFAEISWKPGIEGVPVFNDYNTCFQCSVEHRYDGGDHIILVGRVQEFDNKERDTHLTPLLFYRGQYRNVDRQMSSV